MKTRWLLLAGVIAATSVSLISAMLAINFTPIQSASSANINDLTTVGLTIKRIDVVGYTFTKDFQKVNVDQQILTRFPKLANGLTEADNRVTSSGVSSLGPYQIKITQAEA